MNIKLSNGTILSPIVVTGESRYVQGASRDTLNFIFPADVSMASIDEAFTADVCEHITIIGDDGSENIHTGYTIRAELSKAPVEVSAATAETDAVYEDRVTVSMAQRTYAESHLASLTDTVDVLVMESLMN